MSDSSFDPASLRRASAGPAVWRDDAHGDNGWLRKGVAPGQLHEVFAADDGDAAVGIAFAAALATMAGAVPLLWVRTRADERRHGRVHASGLAELGIAVDTMLLAVAADELDLLRVAGDAARCDGLGAVLIELAGRGARIDLTATRRLMLAAERAGTTVLLVRIGATPAPSAAATRWGVAAQPSRPLAQAPGLPAFDVELQRRRGGRAGRRWCVEWDRDEQAFREAPVSGAGVSLVAGGAAARNPAAPVRRAG